MRIEVRLLALLEGHLPEYAIRKNIILHIYTKLEADSFIGWR